MINSRVSHLRVKHLRVKHLRVTHFRKTNFKVALLLFSFIFGLGLSAKSQSSDSAKNKSPFPVKYTSLVDEKIILKTITLAPVYDNIKGIYAEPIQKLLVDLLQSDKVWGYSEFPEFNKKLFIEKFDSQPNDVLEVLAKVKAQGLLTAYITKGPRGLNAKLKLFTQDQGLILVEESLQDLNIFEIAKLRDSFVTMYHSIKSKLPYRGYVLSRRGLDVTLNLGSLNGIYIGQELSLAQILKLNRHPKLKTMVGVEKEIIAKIKVTKVESYLSFAQIIFEKETGVVNVGAKILPSVSVTYPMPKINSDGVVIGDDPAKTPLNSEAESLEKTLEKTIEKTIDTSDKLAEKAQTTTEKEALLDKKNSFGILTLQGIITQYKESTKLQSGASAESSNNLAPGFNLGVQIYPLKNIFVALSTQFNTFGGDNSLAGSLPFHLNYTFSRYMGSVGFDYAFDDTVADNSIMLTAALGVASYKTDVSVTTPTALTSTQTNTVALQLKAAVPLSPEYPFIVGGGFDIFLSPNFSESPVNSGGGKVAITSLGLFGIYPVSNNLRVRADLSVTNFSVNFSGAATRADPSTSTSIQTLTEQVGIEYLF